MKLDSTNLNEQIGKIEFLQSSGWWNKNMDNRKSDILREMILHPSPDESLVGLPYFANLSFWQPTL